MDLKHLSCGLGLSLSSSYDVLRFLVWWMELEACQGDINRVCIKPISIGMRKGGMPPSKTHHHRDIATINDSSPSNSMWHHVHIDVYTQTI